MFNNSLIIRWFKWCSNISNALTISNNLNLNRWCPKFKFLKWNCWGKKQTKYQNSDRRCQIALKAEIFFLLLLHHIVLVTLTYLSYCHRLKNHYWLYDIKSRLLNLPLENVLCRLTCTDSSFYPKWCLKQES